MSTNPVSASITDATNLLATGGPDTTIFDFASIFEAFSSVRAEKDDAQKYSVELGSAMSGNLAYPATAGKSSPKRDDVKEDRDDDGASADDLIPTVLSSPTAIPICETKLLSEEAQLATAVGIASKLSGPSNSETPTNVFEMRSESVEIKSNVVTELEGNLEVDTALTGVRNRSAESVDSEKGWSFKVAEAPPLAVGSDKSCSKPLLSKAGIGLSMRDGSIQSQDGTRREVLSDHPQVIEKMNSMIEATRTTLNGRALDGGSSIPEIPKGSSPLKHTTKERGTNKPDEANQSLVATGVVAGGEAVASETQRANNRPELQKIVQPPLEQPAERTLPNEGGMEPTSRGSRQELRSDAPVSAISPNLEHWARSTEVQRGVLNLDGKAEMSVHLRSQESGSLEVRTTVQDHRVEASIISTEGQLVNATPEAIGTLRDRLAAHALTLGTLSFQNSAMESGASHDGRRQNETPREVDAYPRNNTDNLLGKSISTGLQSHLGLLNVRV